MRFFDILCPWGASARRRILVCSYQIRCLNGCRDLPLSPCLFHLSGTKAAEDLSCHSPPSRSLGGLSPWICAKSMCVPEPRHEGHAQDGSRDLLDGGNAHRRTDGHGHAHHGQPRLRSVSSSLTHRQELSLKKIEKRSTNFSFFLRE